MGVHRRRPDKKPQGMRVDDIEGIIPQYWPYLGRVIRTGNRFFAYYANPSNHCLPAAT
jgi:hypothetical protein